MDHFQVNWIFIRHFFPADFALITRTRLNILSHARDFIIRRTIFWINLGIRPHTFQRLDMSCVCLATARTCSSIDNRRSSIGTAGNRAEVHDLLYAISSLTETQSINYTFAINRLHIPTLSISVETLSPSIHANYERLPTNTGHRRSHHSPTEQDITVGDHGTS